MANGTLSNYFQKKTAKDISGQAVSPYSAPAGDAAGTAPMGGGPSAPSAPSAPKGSAGGGTGFVSFGQYFGANAPAIQQQAQGAVAKAKNSSTMSLGTFSPASFGAFRPTTFGPASNAGQMARLQAAGTSAKDPYATQITQTQRQSEALQPLANYGDMGENVSAFDQLLGGGVTQRAAKQEQERLGTLRSALEGEQGQYQQTQAQAQQAKADAERRAKEEKAYYDMMDLERRKAEYAASQQEAEDNQSWWDSFMNSLSIGSSRG